jgi:hypothetical protein
MVAHHVTPSRRWKIRLAGVLLLMPFAAISAIGPSSPAEPPPVINRHLDDVQRVVVSTSQSRFDEGVDNQGWWSNVSDNNDDNDNYVVGDCEACPVYARYRNFFTFKLPPLERNVVAARLVLRRYQGTGDITETLSLHHVRTPARQLNNNRGFNLAIYRDLGRGTRYGRFKVATERDPRSAAGFWLNADAIADINAARGSYFSLGGTLTSAHRANGHDEGLFARSAARGVQELRLFVKRPAG